eukprot:243165-Amphidinium_carterae.1
MASVVLPVLASGTSRFFCAASLNETNQLLSARLIAIPILPFLVTAIFHADCFGAWVFFWSPCVVISDALTLSSNVYGPAGPYAMGARQ